MTRATLDDCKCGSIKQAYSKTCRKCYDKSRKILNKPKNNKCKVCQKPCVVIFCSQFCSQEKRRKEHDKKIESDEIVGLKRLKQYLESKNNFCSECNLGNQWNGKSIVLHMDHTYGSYRWES